MLFVPRILVAARYPLLILTAAYVLLYGSLLVRSNFVPYVLDNNESFSSLRHATNMLNFGVSQTYGLTDEAHSPSPAAHPVVEPHNGNMPRLFSLLLLLIDVRSIEAQIVLTTFTVGALGIFLAYRFFERIGNAAFATITTLVLMTDYLLFAQWQVNTWRVWAGVLFFSTLGCVQLMERRQTRWRVLTIISAAFLCYLELVFAAFVAALAALYALWLYRRQLRQLLWSWLMLGVGVVIGAGGLFLQRVAYFGFSTAVSDAYLTLLARNAGGSTPASDINGFYGGRTDVAFLQNIADAGQFRTLRTFVQTFFHYHFELLTPLFTLVLLSVIAGWLLGMSSDLLDGAQFKAWRRPIGSWLSAVPIPAAAWRELGVRARTAYAAVIGAFGLSVLLYLLAVSDGPAILGISPGRSFFIAGPVRGGVAISAAVLACLWTRALAQREATAGRPITAARFSLAVIYLLAVVNLIRFGRGLFVQGYRPLWYDQLSRPLPLAFDRTVMTAAVILGLAMILHGSRRVLRCPWGDDVPKVLPFLVAGGVAYTFVYWLIPGYVATGYLMRYAPFAVYVVDAAVGLAVYCALSWLFVAATHVPNVFQQLKRPLPDELFGDRTLREVGSMVIRVFVRTTGWPVVRIVLATSLCGFMAILWFHDQVTYVRDLPDNGFNTLRAVLARPPIEGSSFVVNNYPGLAGIYTGQWAYWDGDGSVTRDRLRLTSSGYELQRANPMYLWLRDRNNPAYQTPDYFLCMDPETVYELVAQLSGARLAQNRCSINPVVKEALTKGNRGSLVAQDQSGWDSWAIIKLNWDDPPYLAPLPQYGANRLVNFTPESTAEGTQIRIDYAYRQQQGHAEYRSVVRLYTSDTDGALTLLDETSRGTSFLRPPGETTAGLTVSVTPRDGDQSGREYFSDTDYFDDLVLPAPTNLHTESLGQSSAMLAWALPDGATETRIQRRDGPNGVFSEQAVVEGSAQRYVSENLEPGQIYAWRVQACNVQGCSQYSPVFSILTRTPTASTPRQGAFTTIEGFERQQDRAGVWPRWSDGKGVLRLYPSQAGLLSIRLDLAQPRPTGSPDFPNLRLVLNGRPIPEDQWSVQSSGGNRWIISFNQSLKDPTPQNLEIASPTFPRTDLFPNSDDTQRLGVEILGVDIRSGGQPLVWADGLQ